MNYKEAIQKLETDLPEVAEVIKAYVGTINGESAERRLKLTEAAKVIDALKALAGSEEDLIKFVTEIKKKAETTSTSVSSLQAQLDAALAAANEKERLYLLTKAAQVSKADEKALSELLKDVPNSKIEIGDDVKVEGKPLSEYAEGRGKFWQRALFAADGTEPSDPKDEPLPTGGGKEPDKGETNPALEFIDNQAAGIAAVFNARK